MHQRVDEHQRHGPIILIEETTSIALTPHKYKHQTIIIVDKVNQPHPHLTNQLALILLQPLAIIQNQLTPLLRRH